MSYKYDVAISYQNEIEDTAAKIADYLRRENLQVFFAPERQLEILSENLHEVLYDIYKNQTLVRLLLVSDLYLVSEWTQLEKRVSQAENPSDMKRRIVVDYTVNQELPKDLKKLVYIDGNKVYEDEIASLISRRVKDLKNENGGQTGAEERIIFQNKIIQNNYGTQKNTSVNLGDNAHLGDINF
ncbi:MAG: TIR domain-containing protein [Eubacterium sp.]|nr:TIR domain-containing protein [Eubacterium sp.]